ncbi:MAG: glycine cleavage system protein T [Planctomycetes bacterium]|nr:glycine cleavage system protein T [Planctomycetota bacterium]
MRQTPLIDAHRALSATLVPFGGWEMPVMYTDIRAEHEAVRTRAGLFDISHMGRVRIQGPDADAVVGHATTLDVADLEIGRTRYALICNEAGGVVDDILVSREPDGLLLVVNAGNREQDLEVLQASVGGRDANIIDESERLAMIAVQGPTSPDALAAVGLPIATDLKYYRFASVPSGYGDVLVSRTGYTGEIGFELLVEAGEVCRLWSDVLETGAAFGVRPCGLGARDTLRLEAGMPLHGHEIGPEVNPYEAGLDFAVRSELPHIGSEALARIHADGPRRRLIGVTVEGRRIPREESVVVLEGREVGRVCSGTLSPTLGVNIATALVDADAAQAETFTIQIRRHEASATRTPLPFYRRRKEQESDGTS